MCFDPFFDSYDILETTKFLSLSHKTIPHSQKPDPRGSIRETNMCMTTGKNLMQVWIAWTEVHSPGLGSEPAVALVSRPLLQVLPASPLSEPQSLSSSSPSDSDPSPDPPGEFTFSTSTTMSSSSAGSRSVSSSLSRALSLFSRSSLSSSKSLSDFGPFWWLSAELREIVMDPAGLLLVVNSGFLELKMCSDLFAVRCASGSGRWSTCDLTGSGCRWGWYRWLSLDSGVFCEVLIAGVCRGGQQSEAGLLIGVGEQQLTPAECRESGERARWGGAAGYGTRPCWSPGGAAAMTPAGAGDAGYGVPCPCPCPCRARARGRIDAALGSMPNEVCTKSGAGPGPAPTCTASPSPPGAPWITAPGG